MLPDRVQLRQREPLLQGRHRSILLHTHRHPERDSRPPGGLLRPQMPPDESLPVPQRPGRQLLRFWLGV